MMATTKEVFIKRMNRVMKLMIYYPDRVPRRGHYNTQEEMVQMVQKVKPPGGFFFNHFIVSDKEMEIYSIL